MKLVASPEYTTLFLKYVAIGALSKTRTKFSKCTDVGIQCSPRFCPGPIKATDRMKKKGAMNMTARAIGML